MDISKKLAASLKRGFDGPRPGSNAFSLLQLGDSPDCVMGEEIESWIRAGLVEARPIAGGVRTIRGGFTAPGYGEIPDIDCTHRYVLTDSGLAAINGEVVRKEG